MRSDVDKAISSLIACAKKQGFLRGDLFSTDELACIASQPDVSSQSSGSHSAGQSNLAGVSTLDVDDAVSSIIVNLHPGSSSSSSSKDKLIRFTPTTNPNPFANTVGSLSCDLSDSVVSREAGFRVELIANGLTGFAGLAKTDVKRVAATVAKWSSCSKDWLHASIQDRVAQRISERERAVSLAAPLPPSPPPLSVDAG